MNLWWVDLKKGYAVEKSLLVPKKCGFTEGIMQNDFILYSYKAILYGFGSIAFSMFINKIQYKK